VFLLLFGAGCEPAEVGEWACVGPLVDLVRWRDDREVARGGGEALTPAGLAAEERAHLESTVATLAGKRRSCEMTWSLLLYQPPDNPGLRLREETVLRLLDLPPHDYPPEAVGFAGVTVAGRRPIVPPAAPATPVAVPAATPGTAPAVTPPVVPAAPAPGAVP
jgi:hypothetical protein